MNKMKKRSFITISILLVMILMSTMVFSDTIKQSIDVNVDSFQLNLYGKQVEMPDGKHVFIHNDTAYVPLRTLSELMGKKVTWNNNKTIDIDNIGTICNDPMVEQNISGTLWLRSAEGRANAYQAFNLATMMFDKALAENTDNKKLAIVLDIDDAIVDTTGYTAGIALGGEWSGAAWTKWIESNVATALPGAVEFVNYAADKGAAVYYITNRLPDVREATLKSLNHLGFPQAVNEHLLLREAGMASSKESRRQIVAQEHEIVLLVGDNLEDFSDLFVPVNVKDRATAVDKAKDLFGTKFIILPNPMYGDWEKAIFENRKDLTLEQKMEKRKTILADN